MSPPSPLRLSPSKVAHLSSARFPSRRPSRRSSSGSFSRALQGVSILVVDDDEASRKLLELVLGGMGAAVTTVESAEDALMALNEKRPHAIVLDLRLPQMDGLTLARTLKADPETADIVCVAVTALNGPTTRRAALDAGCAHYLMKPVDAEALVAVLADTLRSAS